MVARFNAQEIEMMISAVAFDFDGTLTRPEGIDFYAIRREIRCLDGISILEFVDQSVRAFYRAGRAITTIIPIIDTAAAINISITHGGMGAHPVPEHDSACHELRIVLGFYLEIG